MARPTKQTVDYFPHFVAGGKTLFILENTFGNDGYCFWFKLLEILCSSDAHVYDCNNSFNYRFLLAKTRVTKEVAEQILTTLADLDAIDAELWQQNRVIWVQNLVDNVSDVYKRRNRNLPQKPSLCKQKPVIAKVSNNKNNVKHEEGKVIATKTEQSVNKNPQSKVNNIILNKSKEDDDDSIQESRIEERDPGQNENEKQKESSSSSSVLKYLEKEMGRPLRQAEKELFEDWCNMLEPDALLYAIKLTAVQAGVLTCSYINSVVQNWVKDGVRTLVEAQAREQKRKKPPDQLPKDSRKNDVKEAIRHIKVMLENDFYLDNPDRSDAELGEYLRTQIAYAPDIKALALKEMGLERFIEEVT